ncbi:hypothetical protein ACFQE8_10100 [Salinirubellus sp. GCM10025818]|uniref:hypothetical protein n=1 Tax=Salinirubellus TaxID=2162630 RepID=UPI0030CCE641
MSSTADVAATALTALLVLFVVGYGLLIAQQILLSVLLALLVVLAYVAWRYVR